MLLTSNKKPALKLVVAYWIKTYLPG